MKRVKPTSFVLEPALITRLRQWCESNGVKISWFVATAIREKLEKQGDA